jgi:hypothetical protein
LLSSSALLKGNVLLAGDSQKKATVPKDLAGLTLGTESNPIQCITAWLNELKNKHKTSDLHFIGHGNSDGISLSDQQINCSTLLNNSKLIREWDVERIYLWSCSLGNNTAFLSILESLTGAEVFASKSIVDRDNTRVESNKGNTAYLEQIISSRSLEEWTGNLMAPANSYVTVENGHADNTDPIPADYFSNGEGGAAASAGVALLQSTAWWGDAALAQQWADNSNYESPSLNLDGDIGGSIEEVAFVYAFGGYRPDGTTMWSSKRLTDDWGIDNVTRFWSGGFAVASTPLSGITINQTGPKDGSGNLLTTEAGGSSAFTVVLDTNPTDNVTVNLSGVSTDSGLVAREYSLSAPTLTFTTANWNTAQTVTVTGGDDDYDDGDRTYTLVATASKTGGYAGTERAITTVKNADDDTNGVTIAQTGTNDGSGNLLTTEAGGSSTYTVVLDAEPTADVTVSTTGNDATEGSLSGTTLSGTNTLTFTDANWNTPQTVKITGVDDSIVDGDIVTTLTSRTSNTGGYAGTETANTSFKNRDNDKKASNGAGGGGGNALSFNKIIKDDTSENNSSNKDIEDDADRDGAVDTYEKGVDPTTGKTFDRNNDGIDDYKQRIVASFAASSGQVASLSSQNPILRTSNSTDQENIESKVALLFRGLTAETEYLDGPSINNLQRSIDSTSDRDPLNTIIRTSDQPDFRLIPEVVVDGSINEAAMASYQNDANQIFANKIHRIDYRFEESDINWNALFKPDKTGQLNLLGFDPITGLGGILTDRDGDGRPDGATIFLKDNEKGDLNSNPFVIDDPVGAAELQSSPKLVATSDGRGLTVEGPKGLGLWVRLKTHAADAEWQNSLQLISDQRDEIGGIGATRYSSNLGETEIYLQAGEELYFQQSSNNFSLQESPAFTLEQNTSNKHWILSLDDGGGDPAPDQDYSDLQVSISGHLTPKDMDQYFMARHQTHIHAGVIDLRSQDKEEITLNIDITCDSENVNRLAFIRLDDQDELFSLGGMLPEEGETFQSLARQSLIHPNNEQLMFSGNNQATLQWTLESSEFGLYAPVMITQDDVVHMGTNNISGSQGNALKLLGQNHFGFEDVLNSFSDWDYNNLTVQVSMI